MACVPTPLRSPSRVKEYTDTKTEPVPAKGHTLTAVEAVPATCETAGVKAHWKCSVCGKLFSDAEGKTETTLEKLTIPATGHAYGEPVWKWNDDFTATATFTCGNDTSHVETVNATVTNEVTTAATCKADGVCTYTAKVTFEGRTTPIPRRRPCPPPAMPMAPRCGSGTMISPPLPPSLAAMMIPM